MLPVLVYSVVYSVRIHFSLYKSVAFSYQYQRAALNRTPSLVHVVWLEKSGTQCCACDSGTVLATATTVTAKIKLLLLLSLGFFLLHQVVSSCCLASSQSQAGSLSARILSAFVFYGFTDQIIFLRKVLPRAISAVLCLLMLHHLSAFLWSDPVWCCWMWGALTVQSTSGKRCGVEKSRERSVSLDGGYGPRVQGQNML